jgi:hypothetical protein
MTARGGGVSLGSSDVYVKTDDRTKDQISFQQQLDAAQKMSWQGQVDSKMRRDAEIASNNTGGVVVHHQAAEIKVRLLGKARPHLPFSETEAPVLSANPVSSG